MIERYGKVALLLGPSLSSPTETPFWQPHLDIFCGSPSDFVSTFPVEEGNQMWAQWEGWEGQLHFTHAAPASPIVNRDCYKERLDWFVFSPPGKTENHVGARLPQSCRFLARTAPFCLTSSRELLEQANGNQPETGKNKKKRRECPPSHLWFFIASHGPW